MVKLVKWIWPLLLLLGNSYAQDSIFIPLPEHPRPDLQRPMWQNLNGTWQFRFDQNNLGIEKRWYKDTVEFGQNILVPFPWGSELSGVEDKADIGWYKRIINVPRTWQELRPVLIIGACDWHTQVWLDGQFVGEHRGGYTPFEFDLAPWIQYGKQQSLVLRVDDTAHESKLEGKQGYGRAAGIWQTVYLEARPDVSVESIHFIPDISGHQVIAQLTLNKTAPADLAVDFEFASPEVKPGIVKKTIAKGNKKAEWTIPVPNPRLWQLDDPYLYEVTIHLHQEHRDVVQTYFGMRSIEVVDLPGTDIPYVALNGKPVYLEMTLDQAFHPEGHYTFPSDEFMRDEILRTRRLGLNGQRIHVKIGIPRKLYWADRLGVLIMADVPNSWGIPDGQMRKETEYAMRQMIQRDFNHPSIFSWVLFNETWGLTTDKEYLPETRDWVVSMVRLAKELDPTRLVEDNSPNKEDHVVTDLNTWHAYLPGYAWRDKLTHVSEKTFSGSTWNFYEGYSQREQPNINSECGNVWGYKGSTGDVDWSWDYHIMINEFRRHPKVGGWLYTEHHDVINEWNGYYRYDRSQKFTGIPELVPGMSLRDLHSPFYLATERELCKHVKPGQKIEVPLYASFMTDIDIGGTATVQVSLYGWDQLANFYRFKEWQTTIPYRPWMSEELEPMHISMPDQPGLVILSTALLDPVGTVLQKNFTSYLVTNGPSERDEFVPGRPSMRHLRFRPDAFSKAQWSEKQWQVLDGLKVNGAGSGYFEYELEWPRDLTVESIESATLRFEASAKQLFGKDRANAGKTEGDYMRGRGAHDPSLNRNSYPMTDEIPFPSSVWIYINEQPAGQFDLFDDAADHRGILSWDSQLRDGYLREAGSFGQLITVPIDASLFKKSAEQKAIRIRLQVSDALQGGIAIYGERFGRYPMDPTCTFILK